MAKRRRPTQPLLPWQRELGARERYCAVSLGSGDETHTCRKHECDLGDGKLTSSSGRILVKMNLQLRGTGWDGGLDRNDAGLGPLSGREKVARPGGGRPERQRVAGSSPTSIRRLEGEHPPPPPPHPQMDGDEEQNLPPSAHSLENESKPNYKS